jgi:hypothetical protein
MSPKRKRGGRSGNRNTLACGIVGSEITGFKKTSHNIFERIGENFQNELKLNRKNSLEKNKKRIKLDLGISGEKNEANRI